MLCFVLFFDILMLFYFLDAGKLLENIRVSFGLGIAMKLGRMARLELNYCFPFSYQEGDGVNPGVQFGIGVQFV